MTHIKIPATSEEDESREQQRGNVSISRGRTIIVQTDYWPLQPGRKYIVQMKNPQYHAYLNRAITASNMYTAELSQANSELGPAEPGSNFTSASAA